MNLRSTRSSLQVFLKKVGIYDRLKSSRLYDLYWMLVDGEILNERAKEVDFYRSTLKGFSPGELIFDIGANQGYKTDIFLRIDAKVVSVDPDDANQEILYKRFHALRFYHKPVTIVGKAVSDGIGRTLLWIEKAGSAKNTLSTKWVEALEHDGVRFGEALKFKERKEVATVTLDKLMDDYGAPFFIKIDVEGHELSVLNGMSRPVPYLSFEINLPEFRREGLQCIQRLDKINDNGTFNYTVDCQEGLKLDKWLMIDKFVEVYEKLSDPSIEIFWKTVA